MLAQLNEVVQCENEGGSNGAVDDSAAQVTRVVACIFCQPFAFSLVRPHLLTFIHTHAYPRLSSAYPRCLDTKTPAMVATQPFRLAGTTQTVDIPCDTVDGQNIIFWEEIEYAFPGSQHIIKNGNVTVKLMRDSNHNR
jgi:hypothetical protein